MFSNKGYLRKLPGMQAIVQISFSLFPPSMTSRRPHISQVRHTLHLPVFSKEQLILNLAVEFSRDELQINVSLLLSDTTVLMSNVLRLSNVLTNSVVPSFPDRYTLIVSFFGKYKSATMQDANKIKNHNLFTLVLLKCMNN